MWPQLFSLECKRQTVYFWKLTAFLYILRLFNSSQEEHRSWSCHMTSKSWQIFVVQLGGLSFWAYFYSKFGSVTWYFTKCWNFKKIHIGVQWIKRDSFIKCLLLAYLMHDIRLKFFLFQTTLKKRSTWRTSFSH